MTYSGNEIAALCVKASRGAGLPLGHCEDWGRTAVLLAHRGLLQQFCDALERAAGNQVPINGIIENANIAFAGPTVLDLVGCEDMMISFQSGDINDLLTALIDALGHDITTRDIPGGLEIGQGTREKPAPATGPVDVPEDVMARLHLLAARTYVPATEASRIAGAGAGLTDND